MNSKRDEIASTALAFLAAMLVALLCIHVFGASVDSTSQRRADRHDCTKPITSALDYEQCR